MVEQWIATRELRDDNGEEWAVSIGVPSPDADAKTWSCPFSVVRGGKETVKRQRGTDALQALSLAIEALSLELTQTGATLTWHVPRDGSSVPAGVAGDHGVYRLFPSAMGFDFYKKMLGLVDDETKKVHDEHVNRRQTEKP